MTTKPPQQHTTQVYGNSSKCTISTACKVV